TTQATASWNTAVKAIQPQLPDSFWMVPRAAAQGMYSRQKIIRHRALKGPKPMPSSAAAKDAMPAGLEALTMPNRTAQLDTTTSLAEMPAMRATAICQKPRPMGAKKGVSSLPSTAPKLFDISGV